MIEIILRYKCVKNGIDLVEDRDCGVHVNVTLRLVFIISGDSRPPSSVGNTDSAIVIPISNLVTIEWYPWG